jgi:electron transfer flavoprotein beta subunit
MDILVPIKLVPDLVEELEIDAAGTALDRRFMRLIPSEQDDHALEEALLLKERYGGTVTVVALDTGDVDETLYTAIAKGADRAIKVTGEGFAEGINSHAASAVLQGVSTSLAFDLILTGVQATDDLDGSTGPLLAARLGLPFVGYVLGVSLADGQAIARKEYPGGLVAEMEVALPAVLGIAAAEKPPRYVVTSLVMQAMKTATIEEVEAGEVDRSGAGDVSRMYLPESGARAEMIEGGVEQVADALVALFQKRGLLA